MNNHWSILPAATELIESCSIIWQKAKYTAIIIIIIIIIIINTISQTGDIRERSGRFHKTVGSQKAQVAGPGHELQGCGRRALPSNV